MKIEAGDKKNVRFNHVHLQVTTNSCDIDNHMLPCVNKNEFNRNYNVNENLTNKWLYEHLRRTTVLGVAFIRWLLFRLQFGISAFGSIASKYTCISKKYALEYIVKPNN